MFLRVIDNEARNARPTAARRAAFATSHLEVRMFNVGHGEAILIIFDDERAWLVDGGCSNGVRLNDILGQQLVTYLVDNDLMLEAIVATHPHFDHVGAVPRILTSKSPQVPASITLYCSDDATWDRDADFLDVFWDAIVEEDEDVALRNAHREVSISDSVTAHFFAGSGEGVYTSLFLQLRYHDARLLFTGDAKCGYEIELLRAFGEQDLRADVLKVTHHGSSSGTASSVLRAIRPGVAIVSTGDDGGHRLERDTLRRLGGRAVRGRPRRRRVFETLVDGDIILRTDGQPFGGGVLYQVEFESPGAFSQALGAHVTSLTSANRARTLPRRRHRACE